MSGFFSLLMILLCVAHTVGVAQEGARVPKPHSAKADAGVVIGRSHANRRVRACVFNPRGTIRVLVIGGTHGDEPASAALAARFVESLRERPLPLDLRVVVVPVLNPDGLVAGTRTNKRGVDINRNLPTRDWQPRGRAARYSPGRRAASEPETRALLRLLRRAPDLIISIHAPLACINWDGDAERIAQDIARVNGYKLCPSIGYPTPGSLGTYAGVERAVPTITLELGSARPEELEDAQITALREAITRFAIDELTHTRRKHAGDSRAMKLKKVSPRVRPRRGNREADDYCLGRLRASHSPARRGTGFRS